MAYRSRPPARRRAFTLVEVLLVLVILVIIASLAVTAYAPMQKQANIDAARTQIQLFRQPLELYRLHMGDYPPSLDALLAPPADLADAGAWRGPYIERLPLDPWKRPYQYVYPGRYNQDKPDIYSLGPDGVEGNDDIGNWEEQ